MSTRSRLGIIGFYITLIALVLLLLFGVLVARNRAQRGVWFPGEPLPPPSGAATPLGTTVELTQYESRQALDEALDEAEAMGLGWLRQELRWDRVESEPGQFEWEEYDQAIAAAAERGFRLILFLNRTPEWARRSGEEDNPFAPPAETAEFVEFARAATERYGEAVYGWQVWDQPNLMPHWGVRIILNPDEYTRFLAEVAPAIRAGDPDAVVATAGLGPTTELSGYNMSEVTYLRWLYDAGAARYFDAVALKPFGFWQEVAERVYGEDRLGLDRVVLVRELMEQRGDGEKPIWFVEGGWAVLPPDWQGEPPPWGYDSPATQQRRLYETIRRAVLEWPWVQVIALQRLQPAAPPDDPLWTLALLNEEGERTALGERMGEIGTLFFDGPLGTREMARWEQRGRPALRQYDYASWALGALLLLLAGRLAWHTWSLPWNQWRAWFVQRPEWFQIATIASVALAFYLVDNLAVALLIYAILGLLFAWRFDLGLA
ncbi:MAG: hypothetical protein M3220_19915, partial [Chloroflexota bacterium]|nr:hypothetical protein [Chloroflexota bacterium]